jgi:glycosyltransferase involved in cell wall biosynthesis
LISVVVPAFNEQAHIGQCLDSLMRQPARLAEIIVVDDGSGDGTPAAVDAMMAREPRLRLIQNAMNQGLPATLNRGLSAAKGGYLTWISADNVASDDFIASLASALDERPDVDIVYGDTVLFGGSSPQRTRLDPIHIGLLRQKNAVRSCFMFRRKVLDAVGPYRDRWFKVEDYEFWLRCLAVGRKFHHVAGPYVLHRMHANSLTARYPDKIALLNIFVRSLHLRQCLARHEPVHRADLAGLIKDTVRQVRNPRYRRYAVGWSLRAPMPVRPVLWAALLWEELMRAGRSG